MNVFLTTNLKRNYFGRQVNCFIVDEYYTTKTCSNYGWLNYKLGIKKIYNCEDYGVIIDNYKKYFRL